MIGDWRNWLPAMCKRWGMDFLRIHNGGRLMLNADGSESWHYDGLPLTSIAALAFEGGITGGSGHISQRFDEAYGRDGLLIRRAFEGMSYQPRLVLYAVYLCRASHPERQRALNLSATKYWKASDEGHAWIAGRMSLIEAQYAKTVRTERAQENTA